MMAEYPINTRFFWIIIMDKGQCYRWDRTILLFVYQSVLQYREQLRIIYQLYNIDLVVSQFAYKSYHKIWDKIINYQNTLASWWVRALEWKTFAQSESWLEGDIETSDSKESWWRCVCVRPCVENSNSAVVCRSNEKWLLQVAQERTVSIPFAFIRVATEQRTWTKWAQTFDWIRFTGSGRSGKSKQTDK